MTTKAGWSVELERNKDVLNMYLDGRTQFYFIITLCCNSRFKQTFLVLFLRVCLEVGEVGLEELSHPEPLDLVLSEDLGHLLVGGEVLPVLRVLQVLLLEVGPQELHQLGARRLLLADDGGELGAQLLGRGDSTSCRHGGVVEVLEDFGGEVGICDC